LMNTIYFPCRRALSFFIVSAEKKRST
jgi:hypothetical protein